MAPDARPIPLFHGDVPDVIGELCDLKYSVERRSVDEAEEGRRLVDIRFKLGHICKDSARPMYSDVLPALQQYARRDNGNTLIAEMRELASAVSGYLFLIAEEMEKAGDPSRQNVLRLADHVELEHQRLDIILECFVEEPEIASLEKRVEAARKKAAKAAKKVKKAQAASEGAIDEVRQKYERESITVLGILAAVVLAVTGGITFSATSVNQVAGMHPIGILLVVLGVGFVMYNVMGALFTFLRRCLVRKDEKAWGWKSVAAFFLVDAALFAALAVAFAEVLSAYQF